MGVDWYLDITTLLSYLLHAPIGLQVAGVVVIGMYVIANRVLAWRDSRERARIRREDAAAKATRDGQMRELLTGLTNRVEQTSTAGHAVAEAVTGRLEGLTASIATLSQMVRDVRDRQAEVVGRRDSLAIVDAAFHDRVRSEASDLFDESLRRNAYAERREFVRERVCTALGGIVADTRTSLERDYRLSVDLEPYFTERGGGGLRYALVDRLWSEVEPLYSAAGAVDERVEAMRLRVRNVVEDHVHSAHQVAADIYAGGGG